MFLLLAAALASPPEICTSDAPGFRLPTGPFAPPEAPTRLALDAAWAAAVPTVCDCLPAEQTAWPTSVALTLSVSPEEGSGKVDVRVPPPIGVDQRALLDCVGKPRFTFPAYAYKSDMIVDGEAAPASFVYPIRISLRETARPAPSPNASPAAPDPSPHHR